MFRILSVLVLLTTITLTSSAQSNGWRNANKEAHNKELGLQTQNNSLQSDLVATNNNKIDRSILKQVKEAEIISNQDKIEKGLSRESAGLLGDILDEAKSHMGKSYVWGSKGPNTFDCSGFTGYVYRQFGYQIGACSRDQYKYGKAIDRKNARKGDLIFFTSRRSGKNVGHVGIIWDVDPDTGNIKFIHSSTRRGVIISEFEGYYVKNFVGIKRVIE